MAKPWPDLADCAAEPIRVPGAIQPHGRLVVVDESGGVVAFSANWPGAASAHAAVAGLDLGALVEGDAPRSFGTIGAFEALGHRLGRLAIVEFEEPGPPAAELPLYSLTRHFLPRLQQASTVAELGELAVAEIQRLTGFGRSLFYRFDAEGHGEVLAEARDPGYHSYAGHRFPAADIPAQARALYCINHFRLIVDATYTPVPLVGTDPAWDPAGLDLSFAGLRSVSPIHCEYLRNMGTLASMSVSIVIRGELWGLVSCHDHSPRRVPHAVRIACEHLGRLLSMLIEAKEDNAEVGTRLELRRLTLDIVSRLGDSDATLQRLVVDPAPLLQLANASGAAVVLNDAVWTAGDVPSADHILALADWVAAQGEDVAHTDRIGENLPALGEVRDVAAGVLAMSISQVNRHLVLWFRPEMLQVIQWAGEPGKALPASDGRIHPRLSFASWQEQIRGRSLCWTRAEVAAAAELRQALIGIVLRRAEEMAEVATELSKVNKELEAFSYTVSHDLRAPMRHISGYVDLVLDTEGAALSERAHRYLGHVKSASTYAGQLVDALLEFSRMGRSAIKRRAIHLQVLVDDLVRELAALHPDRRIEWHIARDLPVVHGDPFLIQVTTRNLLDNAVKYTRDRDVAHITVTAVTRVEGRGLEVADNGVGFEMQYANKLFGVFQRLHKSDEFEGTGIGLASVRRIVERHGGGVWAAGELNRGASFGFTLPAAPEVLPC